MIRQGLLAAAAATMMAGTALTPVEPVHAQIPAFLPNKDNVEETAAMEIDGDWRVNTIGKVIRIERGRAYAVEGWTHAFILKVQPDMVTIRNIQQIDETTYVGDDLPMMGKVTMNLVSPDRIEASVPSLLGPARYTLTRVAGSGNADDRYDSGGESPPMFAVVDNPAGAPPSDMREPDRSPRQSYASLADVFGEPRPVAEAFRGCEIPTGAREEMSAPMPSGSPRDRVTGRQFAPVAQDDPMPDMGAECWTRLDGVWVENREPIFNTALNDGREWEVENTQLAGLLHGNYTTPETLFIAPGEDPQNEIHVMSGTNGLQFARYVSSDSTSVADLIGRTGVSKVYQATGDASYGESLTIDYTAGGDLRIRLGQRQFLRPPPAVSNDLSMDDAFVIQFQTDNFAANLKGYNVLTQDPFFLMDNDLGEVFARRDREEYRIQEKYAVPFGFTLRNELLQGNVYRRTIVSSERQIQETMSNAFGVNSNLSISGAINSKLSFLGRGEIADTGFSVGQQSTRETMRAMRNSQSVAQVVGYSRAKSYAIVAQHADLKLSDDFLTAVVDAKHDGNYNALINRFGTHYAYAVTYGANAKMTQDISEKAVQTVLAETQGDRREAEVRILGSSIGGFSESMKSGVDETGGRIGNEGGRFVAVGGNGSWDASGYARGDRVAPILLDLRPLDELLNPINFPDQPEIYTRVRAELAQSINGYLAGQARPLSNERLISKVTYIPPAPDPEPVIAEGPAIEEWHVYVRHIKCLKPGIGTTKAASGDISISATGPSNGFAQSKTLRVDCKLKNAGNTTYDYRVSPNTPGLMTLRGTREQMREYLLKFDFSWNYEGVVRGKPRNDQTTLNDTPLQTGSLSVGQSDTTRWVIGPKGRPAVSLYLRVKRIK